MESPWNATNQSESSISEWALTNNLAKFPVFPVFHSALENMWNNKELPTRRIFKKSLDFVYPAGSFTEQLIQKPLRGFPKKREWGKQYLLFHLQFSFCIVNTKYMFRDFITSWWWQKIRHWCIYIFYFNLSRNSWISNNLSLIPVILNVQQKMREFSPKKVRSRVKHVSMKNHVENLLASSSSRKTWSIHFRGKSWTHSSVTI